MSLSDTNKVIKTKEGKRIEHFIFMYDELSEEDFPILEKIEFYDKYNILLKTRYYDTERCRDFFLYEVQYTGATKKIYNSEGMFLYKHTKESFAGELALNEAIRKKKKKKIFLNEEGERIAELSYEINKSTYKEEYNFWIEDESFFIGEDNLYFYTFNEKEKKYMLYPKDVKSEAIMYGVPHQKKDVPKLKKETFKFVKKLAKKHFPEGVTLYSYIQEISDERINKAIKASEKTAKIKENGDVIIEFKTPPYIPNFKVIFGPDTPEQRTHVGKETWKNSSYATKGNVNLICLKENNLLVKEYSQDFIFIQKFLHELGHLLDNLKDPNGISLEEAEKQETYADLLTVFMTNQLLGEKEAQKSLEYHIQLRSNEVKELEGKYHWGVNYLEKVKNNFEKFLNPTKEIEVNEIIPYIKKFLAMTGAIKKVKERREINFKHAKRRIEKIRANILPVKVEKRRV